MIKKTKKLTKTSTNKTKTAKPITNASKFAIFGIILAAIIVIIIGIVAAVNIANPTVNESIFVSDGTKYVINVKNTEAEDGDPIVAHVIYYYNDNNITGAESYYEFTDEEAAKTAYEELKQNADDVDNIDSYTLKGKYVILKATSDAIKNITVDAVRSQAEFYNSIQNSADSEDE